MSISDAQTEFFKKRKRRKMGVPAHFCSVLHLGLDQLKGCPTLRF